VIFQGTLRKEGRFWLAEVAVLDAMTQGRSRKDALDMIADWFATMVDRRGFKVEVEPTGHDRFDVYATDTRRMISLLLQRQRRRSGLSLAQVADRLRVKSRNAYARYEQGVSVPTVDKLDELLRAVAPSCDLVLQQRHG
jgi:hypothetical protein